MNAAMGVHSSTQWARARGMKSSIRTFASGREAPPAAAARLCTCSANFAPPSLRAVVVAAVACRERRAQLPHRATMAADELEAFAETERLGRLYTGGGVAVTADGAHVACGCEGALQLFASSN